MLTVKSLRLRTYTYHYLMFYPDNSKSPSYCCVQLLNPFFSYFEVLWKPVNLEQILFVWIINPLTLKSQI